jgi:type II secretory pathway pseudopilin PulG
MLVLRLRTLLRSERGFSLIELISSMAILMTVMGGLTALLVSGTNAEVDMNRKFQAQSEARLGLDKLRRDVHCAWNVATAGTPTATIGGLTYYPRTTLTMNASCPSSGGSTSITWCTVANGTGRYGLWRYAGAACSGTGRRVADYLTTQTAFTYTAPIAGSKELKKLGTLLAVNVTPTRTERVYTLQDTLVLRNSVRA